MATCERACRKFNIAKESGDKLKFFYVTLFIVKGGKRLSGCKLATYGHLYNPRKVIIALSILEGKSALDSL